MLVLVLVPGTSGNLARLLQPVAEHLPKRPAKSVLAWLSELEEGHKAEPS